MKKIISEEIENMKYLLGYKRGTVVSEQSTPVPVPSSTTTPSPVTTAPATAPVTPETKTTQPIKMGVKNPRVQVLQQLLNDKFQSGLVADGIYGPKTANAIYKNIVAINKSQFKPVTSDLKPAETTQQPAPQINASQVPTTAATPK